MSIWKIFAVKDENGNDGDKVSLDDVWKQYEIVEISIAIMLSFQNSFYVKEHIYRRWCVTIFLVSSTRFFFTVRVIRELAINWHKIYWSIKCNMRASYLM